MTPQSLNIYCVSLMERKSLWLRMGVVLVLLLGMFCGTSNAFDTELNLKPTKYTEYSKNVTYRSTTEYNARGMKPLYDITQKVMWLLIGGKDPLPDGK